MVKKADFGLTISQFIGLFSWNKAPLLILAIVLIPINWLIESEKWHGLMNKFVSLSRWKSIKSIISGITLGIATPSRVGEYGGRMLFVPSNKNAKAAMTTFVGSFAQNIVNITFGALGLIVFVKSFQPEQILWSWAMTTVVTAALIILYIFYFNLEFVDHLRSRFKIFDRRWIKDLISFKELDFADLIRVWILSILRYVVYLLQYLLVAYFFGIELHGILAIAGIATIFLIQGSLPLPPFLGVLARGEIAIIIWRYYDANDLSILSATYALWALNVVLPAIIGYVFVLKVNIFESIGLKNLFFNNGK